MEIKRRLNAVAKRITPEIEVMNPASEIRTLCSRLEELATYCEEKVERAAQSKAAGKTKGQLADEAMKAERKRIKDIHDAEAKEAMEDRQQQKAQPESKPKKKAKKKDAG
jgi:hypothetical protein